MGRYEILRFPSDKDLARAVAGAWIEELKSADKTQPYLTALSGGRIAKTFCTSLVELVKSNANPLLNVNFFWADERCVPSDHPDSNYFVADKCLFGPLSFPSEQIHRIHGEDPPQAAAAIAEETLRRIAVTPHDSKPILDMIFLGMGEDGHIASLFPEESPEARANPAIYRAVTASKPPPSRVTLGYETIASAREVWVLASGAGKENALRSSLLLPPETPLGYLLDQREFTKIFTDIRV